ncbi:MAG: hypothetical protein J0L82_13475 [Deltaproteobacteria bacterium]|nr:hypothetical protein [Deltaproteobacteria bacterium]
MQNFEIFTQTLRSVLRHTAFVATFVLAVLTASSFHAHAAVATSQEPGIPVYLRPESRYPSGFHARDWLEARTRDSRDAAMQRWFRVQHAGQYGWVAEDHLLTSLKMSSIARTVRNEPDRSAPSMDALRSRRIPKNSQVIILETTSSWSRGRVLGDSTPNHDSWILNEALIRDQGNQIERAVVFRETPVRLQAKSSSAPIDRLPMFKEISVIQTKDADGHLWLEFQTEAGSAWIDRRDAWLPVDLADGSVRTLVSGLELRSSPYPNSDIIKHLQGPEVLKVIDSKYLRWGYVKVPEHGFLWWPISDDRVDQPGFVPPMKVTTSDLLNRAIFDMVASDAVPGLRFASAKGIFKSRDGREWAKIPKFEDKNYPLAITKSGLILIGPYMSRDHGESFEQWIRWDRLVEKVKTETGLPPARLRISNVSVINDKSSLLDVIEVQLDVGRSRPVRMRTADRGVKWVLQN